MQRIIAKHESEVPQMKTVGVIGGMGQWATLDIINRIFKASVDHPVPQYGNRGYPELVMQCVNKAPMVLNPDGSYPKKLQPSNSLLEAAEFIGKSSDFIVMTSNTAHIFAQQIQEYAGKELISLVDLAVAEAKKRKYARVGVLAIGVTLREKLFQNALAIEGIVFVTLPAQLEKDLEDKAIYPLQEGAKHQDIGNEAAQAVEYLRNNKVDGIILGCTELPILLGDAANDPDIINPSQLLADEVIRKSLS
jgi:aspartate racemase